MNNIAITSGLILLIFSFISCKKEYTCTCKTSTFYTSSHEGLEEYLPPAESTSTTSTTVIKKKESEDWCNKRENEEVTGESFGSISYTKTVSTKCSL